MRYFTWKLEPVSNILRAIVGEPARPTGPAHPKMNSPLKSAIVINNRFNLSVIRKLVKLLYLHCSCKKVVEKSNKENLKVIKNTSPNKSGIPESLKKYSEQLESFSSNVHIVGKDLLTAF